MRHIFKLWFVILTIVILWIYFIFISPRIFNNEIITVPDITAMSEEQAIKTLNASRVKYKIFYVENDKDEALKTIPYAGTKVKVDNPITVYIGKVMPDKYRSFLGQLYEDVAEQISLMCEKNKLNLKLEYEENPNVISGLIVKESLVDGTVLDHNTTELCLTISVNNSSFLMPNLVGLKLDEALAILKTYKLKANIIYYQTPIDEDIVLFQSTSPNTLINVNNHYKLDIYVSKGLANSTEVDVAQFIEIILYLGYDLEIKYVKTNEKANKLVAFNVQKLYDSKEVKYTLLITE